MEPLFVTLQDHQGADTLVDVSDISFVREKRITSSDRSTTSRINFKSNDRSFEVRHSCAEIKALIDAEKDV